MGFARVELRAMFELLGMSSSEFVSAKGIKIWDFGAEEGRRVGGNEKGRAGGERLRDFGGIVRKGEGIWKRESWRIL